MNAHRARQFANCLTHVQDHRVECPDCWEGVTEWGRKCWTCEGAGYWMADDCEQPVEETPWQAGARMIAEMREKGL